MALDLRFSHVVLQVRDLEAMIDFYTRVLEFEVVDRGPLNLPDRGDLGALESEIVFMSQDPHDHHQVAMVPFRKGDERGAVDHVALRTGSAGDVRDLAKRLRDEEDVKIRQVSHGNTWSVYFSDPEGNGIEIFAKSPYHVDQPQVMPIDLFQSDDELHAWIEEKFADQPGFRPIADYEAERVDHLSNR